MRKFKFPEHHTDVWVSDDQLEEIQTLSKQFGVALSWKDEVGRTLSILLKQLDGYEEEYATLFMQHIGKPRIACLIAHGGIERRQWVFSDGARTHQLQPWIKQREKDYGLLILCCCNEGGLTPTSQSSLLFVPDSAFSIAGVESGSSNFNLIHPTKGELEYVIEYELAELRRTTRGAT